MQMQLPRVGDVVDEKYELVEAIGEGGFAVVYRATDLAVGRSVAVKLLKPGPSGYAVTVASRFAREARALAGLSDAHTLRLFDFGRSETGILFMVSELLSGRDLRELLRERNLTEEEGTHIMRQVLCSLREAHDAGILHRDIKPSNIQVFEHLDDPLRVKVLDFGIARPTGPDAAKLTQTGVAIGTPKYMSPEQAVAAPVTPSSDLFSLALVMAEILTGDPRAPLDAIYSGRQFELPATPKLTAIIERMLQQVPDRRFATADEVLAALDTPAHEIEAQPWYNQPRATAASPEPLRPPSNPYQPYPERRGQHSSDVGFRRPTTGAMSQVQTTEWIASPRLLAVLGVACVVVVFGVGVMLLSRRDAEPVVEQRSGSGAVLVSRVEEPAPDPDPDPVLEPAAAVDLGTADAADVGPPPSGCGNRHKRGAHVGTHALGHKEISWTTWVPRRYDPDRPTPVVMLVHGSDGEARDLLIDGGGSKVADKEGFIIVAPEGKRGWSFEEENSETFRVMFDNVAENFCVDRQRVFVFGHDTGGYAASRLLCESWVAGAATSSWRPKSKILPCDTPKPRIIFSPKESRHLPLEGGTQCVGRQIFFVGEFERLWTRRNRCEEERTETVNARGTQCWEWRCEGAPLASCHVDGGHNWNGMTKRRFDILGCDGPPGRFDYTAAAWDFFSRVEAR